MRSYETMSTTSSSDKKMSVKDFISTGVFGAVYIVLTLIIQIGSAALSPLLYFLAPLTVGLLGSAVYMYGMLKVQKFGAALLLGGLVTAVTCYHSLYAMLFSLAAALTAELMLFLGKYQSQKLYRLSFVFFNLNMAAPDILLLVHYERFMSLLEKRRGFAYAHSLAKLAFNGKIWYIMVCCALAGGIGGALITKNLVKKYFEKHKAV